MLEKNMESLKNVVLRLKATQLSILLIPDPPPKLKNKFPPIYEDLDVCIQEIEKVWGDITKVYNL